MKMYVQVKPLELKDCQTLGNVEKSCCGETPFTCLVMMNFLTPKKKKKSNMRIQRFFIYFNLLDWKENTFEFVTC